MCNGRQELGHCPVLASKWVNPTSATRASKWVNPISAREMTESPVPVDHHTYLLFKFLKYAAAILLGRHVRGHGLRLLVRTSRAWQYLVLFRCWWFFICLPVLPRQVLDYMNCAVDGRAELGGRRRLRRWPTHDGRASARGPAVLGEQRTTGARRPVVAAARGPAVLGAPPARAGRWPGCALYSLTPC